MKAREGERMERLSVARASAHRFFETLEGHVGLAPARRAQSSFARTHGRRGRHARGFVVGLERFVETMRELERMPELDIRRGIVGRTSPFQLGDLGLRRRKIAGRSVDAHQKTARLGVVGMFGKLRFEELRGFLWMAGARQRHGAFGDGRTRAGKPECAQRNHRNTEHHVVDGASHQFRLAYEEQQMSSIKIIGVLGAGQMGSGIAQVAAAAGFQVRLADMSLEQAKKGIARIESALGRQVEKGKMSAEAKDALVGSIQGVPSIGDFATCDLVIEAATENVDLKIDLFKKCDAALPAGKILATNTSSISVTKLAGITSRPDRVIGMHFMNPVPLMKLVEIVRAVQTTDETYRAIAELAAAMGKTIVTSKDAPGFLVNRMLIPMLIEACFVLQEGLGTPADIDQGAKLGLNHPMGPLELSDLIGLDTVLFIAEVLHRDLGDSKYRAPTLLRNLVAAGWVGKKSGRGFYAYDEKGQRTGPAVAAWG